jgi:2-octaprenyl-6-methoxyphenol hydroxylase
VAERRDIVIVGGGPIGCALTCALRASGRDCLLLEARAAEAAAADARTLALSFGSRLMLERIDAWRAIKPVTPITSIHVSQRGGFGGTMLQAEEVGLEALGYVAPFAATHAALLSEIRRSGLELRTGVKVTSLQSSADSVEVCCETDGEEWQVWASLAVIADGGAALGAQLGTTFAVRDYRQVAIVGMVRADRPHAGRAYERFTPDGPVALLPASEEFALVWSCRPDVSPRLLSLPDRQFLSALQSHFGDRAGEFTSVRGRAAFPLSLRYAREPVGKRAVLLGNASQALHPIAGQGFNLGLRDAWDLSQLIRDSGGADPGSVELLARYRRSRRLDRFAGIFATDMLTRLFSTEREWVAPLRGAGIVALDLVAPAKRFLMRRMIFGSAL